MDNAALIYVACLIGIVARTVVPYLQQVKETPNTQFDKKFLVPVVVSIVLNLFLAPFILSSVSVTGTSYFAAYILGWGATDQIRELVKFAGANVPALKWLE